MKETGKLQREILVKKKENIEDQIQKVEDKIQNLELTRKDLRLSLERIKKNLDLFGKSVKPEETSKADNHLNSEDHEDVQEFLESLTEEQRRSIAPSILRENPTVEFLKEILQM